MPGDPGRERGQATVEWLALIALVSIGFGSLAWVAGLRLPGASLGRELAERLICAIRLSDSCRSDPALYAAYGGAVAALVRAHAPTLVYERGMRALPVDFRRCRRDVCAEGAERGRVTRSLAGSRVVAFTHVVDCRNVEGSEPGEGEHGPRAGVAGYDCTGPRRGNLYVQYWLYYPGSATAEGTIAPRAIRRASSALGSPTFHDDDWESFQVRIGPDGRLATRASSHHGHNGPGGARNWGSDVGAGALDRAAVASGLRPEGGWHDAAGRLYVSGGSHAGHTSEPQLRRAIARAAATASLAARDRVPRGRFARRTLRRRLGAMARRLERRWFGPGPRITPRGAITLVPIEPLRARARFAVTPPWRKRVYYDPEYPGTD